MILKAFPYLLVLLGILGFFVSPDSLGTTSEGSNALKNLVLMMISLPWWGKVLSILVGLIWILVSYSDSVSNEDSGSLPSNKGLPPTKN
jgi:hypothetical protein